MEKLFRILLVPFGFLYKIAVLSIDGSRDISNKLKFKGSIIDRGCCIGNGSRIESRSHILEGSYFLNSSIAKFSYVGRNCLIQNAKIGAYCSIANDVFIGLGSHPIDHFSTSPLFYRVANTFKFRLVEEDSKFIEYRTIELGNDVWIGARAIVMDGVQVGHGAIVAANSVVTKDVPNYAVVAGVPAKIIRYRFSPEGISRLLKLQWWDWPLEEIQRRRTELEETSV